MKRLITSLSFLMASLISIFSQTGKFSNADLVSMMDSIVSNNMEAHQIPGVGYAIINNDKVIHLGTQGFAKVEGQQVVTSETTFMLGSIAKLFTTIAVLQLFEAGKVELDEDINTYLKTLKLPYSITLRQLLTHTAGLEESVFERVKLSPDNFLTLEDYLEKKLPEQIVPPDKYPAYSNHGMALAGLVVQEISGQRFEDFIQERIFNPLGMNNSSFKLDEVSKKNLATPYRLKNGKLSPTLPQHVQTIPASMLISNAKDMAKFMLTLLNSKEARILNPATLQLMKTTQYTPHPNLWGRGFGFFERNFREVSMLEHGGSRKGYYSQLNLVPKDSLGVFLVFNGGKSSFRSKVIFDFLEKVYPKIEREKHFNNKKIDLSPYEGTYLSNRRGASDFGKLLLQATFVEKIKVEASNKEWLNLLGYDYQIASEDQFEIINNPMASFPVAFGRNNDGEIAALFLPGRSDSFFKMRWYEQEEIGIATFVLSIMVFIFLIVSSLFQILKGKLRFQLNGVNSFRTYQLLHCVINLLFLVTLISVFIVNGENLEYKIPLIMYPIFSLSLFGLLPLVLMIYHFFRHWILSSQKEKIVSILFLVFVGIYTWQLYYWSLMGFNF